MPLPIQGKKGRDGPPGKSKALLVTDESFSFVKRVNERNYLHLLSKQENFFLVRPKKVVPQPLLVSTAVNHVHQRFLTKRSYQTSVSSSVNQWLVKTVQRKSFQLLSNSTNQTFVRQQQTLVQKTLLQPVRTEAFLSKRHYTQKKTQMLQTFQSSTNVVHKCVQKTVQLYHGPVSYHFVTNNSRLERLLQRSANNGLIFTGDSSMVLTGDAGVLMA